MPGDTVDEAILGENADDAEGALEDGDLQTESPDDKSDTDKEQLLDGKFKNVDELQKAYRNSEASKTRAEQKAADLERRLSQLESNAAVAQKLGDLADAIAKNKGGPNETELKRQREEMIERMSGENGPQATYEVIQGAFAENRTYADAAAERRAEALKKELVKLTDKVAELEAMSDPVLKKHSEKVGKVAQQLGISKVQAAKVLADAGLLPDESADGSQPPGGTAANRPSGGGNGKAKKQLTSDELRRWRQWGFSDKEIKDAR